MNNSSMSDYYKYNIKYLRMKYKDCENNKYYFNLNKLKI